MAAVSNSVVHLTMRFGPTVLSIGTGVLYERAGQYFIITAWHNVTGLHPETLNHLSKNGGVPDNIVVRMVVRHLGIGLQRMEIILPLFGEEGALFHIHPKNWPRIDVVAIPFDPTADHVGEIREDGKVRKYSISLLSIIAGTGVSGELCPVQKFLVPAEDVTRKWLESVEVTEELFIPGYPHNVQDYYSEPVWKRATIASSVQTGWNREPKFLVDSASKSGMSGSPVFYYSPNGEVRIMGSTYRFDQDVAILVGIYVGRIGVTKEADPQVGIVWHKSVIDEIIEGKLFERLPAEIEISPRVLEAAVKEALSSCSRKGLENVNNPDMPSRFYLQNRVLEIVDGRASPKHALDEILAIAQTYDGPLIPGEN